jgi:hypothetical protein
LSIRNVSSFQPGHHLRPIRASDVEIDYPAVMGSRASLWTRFGEMWGWPAADMSYEADLKDLARHEAEIAAHVTFNYAVLHRDETELLGCVYIDPPSERAPAGADALVSRWVVDSEVGGDRSRFSAAEAAVWVAEEDGDRKGRMVGGRESDERDRGLKRACPDPRRARLAGDPQSGDVGGSSCSAGNDLAQHLRQLVGGARRHHAAFRRGPGRCCEVRLGQSSAVGNRGGHHCHLQGSRDQLAPSGCERA